MKKYGQSFSESLIIPYSTNKNKGEIVVIIIFVDVNDYYKTIVEKY